MERWLKQVESDPRTLLLPSPKGQVWGAQNYLNRALKPAPVRTRIGIYSRPGGSGVEVESTDVNFQVLRRPCATLFGAKAKDPRDTQAQHRHADPAITLRHYQKSIPASVRSAAVALEAKLMNQLPIAIRSGSEQVEISGET